MGILIELSQTAPGQSLYGRITSFEIPMVVLLVALVALLFVGARFSRLGEWQESPLGLETSKAVQGFSAVCIIIHHLAQGLMERAGVLGFFSELGVLFVGVFFFFSGYGLYTSLKTKEDYLKRFLKKRLVTVLIPFYMCILVFVVCACICGASFSFVELLGVLSGWSLINSHMWYIVEIAILYLAFFVIYRLIRNRTAATAVMGLFVVLMIVGSLLLGHGEDYSCRYWFMGEWWYNSSLLFVVGIVVAKHADLFRKVARKFYLVLLPVTAALTVFLGIRTTYVLNTWSYWSEIPGVDPAYGDKFRCLAVQLPWIIVFVLFVILVMMRVRFGNPILKFLGSISLELYLIHNLFLAGLQDGTIANIKSASMYILFTILLSVGLATVLSGVDKYLISVLTGKRKELRDQLSGSRIHSIDVMRIVMAFLVVTIHWPFNGKAGQVFITYGKTAVPFFLVVCGYLLYREDRGEMMKRLSKQAKRMLVFYVASFVFYMLVSAVDDKIHAGNISTTLSYLKPDALLDLLLYNFPRVSEHLWYLGSLLYALVVLLVLNKLKILDKVMFLGPVLVALYVVLSHLGIGEYYQLRNAVLVGLSYTMTGMLIRRYEKKIFGLKFVTPVLWVLFAVCMVTAVFELNGYERGTGVPFVSCEILTVVIVLLCLRYPNFGKDTYAEKLGREGSLPIYIMHIFVLYIVVVSIFPEAAGFVRNYAAVTGFVITAVGAMLYKGIKHSIVSTR